MPEVAGYKSKVYILAGTTAMTDSTGSEVKGVDSATMNKLADILDISAFGDEHKKRMAGQKDTEFDISGNYHTDDTDGQDVLEAGADVYVGLYLNGTDNAGTQIPAIVENIEQSSEITNQVTFSASFAANGAPEELPAQA